MSDDKKSLLESAINGNIDTHLARATVKQLSKDIEKSGKTTFTFKELREARRKLFEGE